MRQPRWLSPSLSLWPSLLPPSARHKRVCPQRLPLKKAFLPGSKACSAWKTALRLCAEPSLRKKPAPTAAKIAPSVANAVSVVTAALALKANAAVATAAEAEGVGVMRAESAVQSAVSVPKAVTTANRAVSAMPKAGLSVRLLKVVKAGLKAFAPKARARVKPVQNSGLKVAAAAVSVASAVTVTAHPATLPSKSWHWPTKPLWLQLHVAK